MKHLPNLSNASRLMSLSYKLEKVKEDTIFGYSIKQSIVNGKLKDCIAMIAEQAKDNREMICKIVGEDTLKEIESL